MKILYIAQRCYPHIGGVEYVVKSIAERLARQDHEIIVICGEQEIEIPREDFINGVHVVRWPVWSPNGAYHMPKMRSKLVEKLRELVRGCDVVHFHSLHSVFTMYALDALKRASVHKVLTAHYHGTGHTFIRSLAWIPWRIYVKNLLKHVDIVHAVSKHEGKLLERDFGVNYIVIEHGVEEWLAEVEWRPSGYVMYSGRIEKYKNIHRLANIVKHLNEIGLDFEFKVFGEGAFKKRLERHLKELGIKYEINPSQPYEKYIGYLSRAHLFGLLSQREAYGQTINEANAIGVPVVIAMSWGLNFRDRSRTLIVELEESDREIARKVAAFLDRVRDQPKSGVPSWSKVVDLYVKRLYRDALFQ